jgi:uncharacterized C2H2 Zn-finger protein
LAGVGRKNLTPRDMPRRAKNSPPREQCHSFPSNRKVSSNMAVIIPFPTSTMVSTLGNNDGVKCPECHYLGRSRCDLIAHVAQEHTWRTDGSKRLVKQETPRRLHCLSSLDCSCDESSLGNNRVGIANVLDGSKSYDIRAVELSGIGAHDQPERRHVFVGVHCPLCNTGYSVEIPPCENNDGILVDAIDGTRSRLKACGSHPPEISFRIVGRRSR